MRIFQKKYNTLSDESLMAMIQKQNVDAFNELYQRYSQRILAFFYRAFNGDKQLAQDMTQTIFLKILEKSGLFDPNQSFASWFFKIAYNMCKNEYRNRDVRSKIEYLTDDSYDFHKIEDERLSPDIEAEFTMFNQAMTAALEKLKPLQRKVFLLRFQQQLSCKEISEIMGCPEGTVKSRLHYATQQLANDLKAFNPNP